MVGIRLVSSLRDFQHLGDIVHRSEHAASERRMMRDVMCGKEGSWRASGRCPFAINPCVEFCHHVARDRNLLDTRPEFSLVLFVCCLHKSSILRSRTMARTKVANPFKPKENIFVHYAVLLLLAFLLTSVVVLYQSTYSSEPTTKEDVKTSADKAKKIATGGAKTPPSPSTPTAEESPAFDQWLSEYYRGLEWPDSHGGRKKLTPAILQESLDKGCNYLATNQHEAGNFNYQYDFVKQELDEDDSQVRQAGALWGITLCYQHDPSNGRYRESVEKGLRFFFKHAVSGPKADMMYAGYPGESVSEMGTNALLGLSIVDYLRATKDESGEFIAELKEHLKKLVNFFRYMQKDDLHFCQEFDTIHKEKDNSHSPYFDGESMLFLVKVAKYIDGYSDLIPLIETTTPVLAKAYTQDVWPNKHDSDLTKGFYQWSSMFMAEYYQAGWKNSDQIGTIVLMLGHWIIYTHNILKRRRNTGYAFEGIASAYEIAKSQQNEKVSSIFASVIDEGLYKLTTWQVGGPLSIENHFLLDNPTAEEIAIGGVMNARNEAELRIDTTQHQMHAVAMAIDSLYHG